MKKLLALLLLLAPVFAQAAIATPWNATSTDKGYITPNLVNGNAPWLSIFGTGTSTFAGPIKATCFSVDGTTCLGSGGTTYTGLYPISIAGSVISFLGLTTSTPAVVGNIPYFSGANTLANVATSTLTPSSPLTGSFAYIGTGGSLGCQTASGSQAGCLSSTDWNTFNNKGSGTVTSISVASANGFAGSSSGGATPALTLSTSITGVLKGNGTAISAASNGTDFTLNTAKTCSAGDFVSAVTAAGVFTCTTPSGTTYTGTWPITITGSVISFSGLSTTSQPTAGQLLYSNGTNGLTPVSTTSATIGTGLSYSGTFGALVGGAGGTLTATLGTNVTPNELNNAMAANSIPYSDGAGTLFKSVATSTLAVNASISSSGTLGYLVDGAASTLSLNLANPNTWTALQTFANASTTLLSASYASSTSAFFGTLNLPNITGTQCLHSVSGVVSGTGSDCGSGSGGVTSVTGTYPIISSGGATPAISLAFGTSTSNTWGGTQTFTNPIVDGTLTGLISGNSGTTYATATSTLTASSPLTGSFTQVGSGGSLGCQTASGSQAGCLSSADWTTFNGKQASGNYITALTGDVTASGPGSAATTLATVNANVGSFGGATSIPTFTVNAKGLITAASAVTPSIPVGDITGILPIANGGTATSTFYSGGVLFSDGSKITQSAAPRNFFWDEVNKFLGIGTTTPKGLLSVQSITNALNVFSIANSVGSTTVEADTLDTGAESFLVASSSQAANKFEFAVDKVGHLMTGGTAPTCGTGCTSVAGDDNTFRAVTGSGVTAVTVNFANTWRNSSGTAITPVCNSSDESGGTTVSDASSTPTSVTMNLSASLTSKNLAVNCIASDSFTQ